MASSSSFVRGFPFLCMDEAYPPSAKTKPKEQPMREKLPMDLYIGGMRLQVDNLGPAGNADRCGATARDADR